MIKQTARVPIVPLLFLEFIVLTLVQWQVPAGAYTTFSIFIVFVVFTFKAWVNLVCAVTMYRQHGTSALARAVQSYFWALLGQSVMLAVLYFLAFSDAMEWALTPLEIAEIRNALRNLLIIALSAVIIYGARMLDALFDYLRAQQRPGHVQDGAGLP